MSQQWGIPKSIFIFSIFFVPGLLLTMFMQGLAYSYGLTAQATEISGSIAENITWTLTVDPGVTLLFDKRKG